jgi:hypothetical protein
MIKPPQRMGEAREGPMAEHDTIIEKADGMDYPEHERTYSLFVWLVKWTTISVAVVLVLMALFLL